LKVGTFFETQCSNKVDKTQLCNRAKTKSDGIAELEKVNVVYVDNKIHITRINFDHLPTQPNQTLLRLIFRVDRLPNPLKFCTQMCFVMQFMYTKRAIVAIGLYQ